MAKRRIKKPVRKKKSDYPGEMSFRKALGMNPTYYQEGGKLYYQENTGQLPPSTGFNFSGYLDGNQGLIPDYNNISTKSHISNILLKTPLPVVKPADKPKNKPKKSDVLDLDNSLDYLVNTRGGTRDLWGNMADTIGYHESAHTMDPLQKQIGGGPGRGIFQFEAPSLVTAKNRYKRIAGELKLKPDPEILSAKSALELSPEQQYSLFLINLSESKAKLKDYADNKLPLVDLWLQGHKNKEAKGDRGSFRTSVQKAKKDSINSGYSTLKEFGGKLRYARGGSLTSAQDTAQAADLNQDIMRKDIKKASVGEDFMAGLYGVGEGVLDTLTFGLTDELTDAGFKALQAGAGHDVNSDEAKRQAGIKGWGNVGGAVTGALVNPASAFSAGQEGLEGIGQGIQGINPSNQSLQAVGKGVEGLGNIQLPKGMESMEGMSKLFMARNGGRFRYGYRGGGHMLSQNMGLTEIDGPSHEQGGVTLPNSGGRPDVEVEGPETIYTPENYVMSEKMKASKEALEYAGIIGKAASRLAGKSYADLSKSIKSKAGDKLRPADPLSKKMLDKEMKRLMMAHEYDREAKRMKDEAMRSQMMGGSNVVAETPEERAGGYNMYPNAESIAFPGNGATSVVPTNNNDPIMVTGADGNQQMLTDEPIETEAPFIEEKMAQGGKMIKRADGSYSRRGLWDNIRANRGSGRKPTKQMLEQEAKIKAAEKAYGGYYADGGKMPTEVLRSRLESHMSPQEADNYLEQYADGGSFNNPGFRALPSYVQAKIKSNMALGGFMGDYIDEDDTIEYGSGGYTVRRSNDRKGKTHVVTGPDGTKKYFGDPNLGERGKSKYGKDAFYARHKKNLAKNPYFRAYARATWEDGGYMNMLDSNVDMVDMQAPMYQDGGPFLVPYSNEYMSQQYADYKNFYDDYTRPPSTRTMGDGYDAYDSYMRKDIKRQPVYGTGWLQEYNDGVTAFIDETDNSEPKPSSKYKVKRVDNQVIGYQNDPIESRGIADLSRAMAWQNAADKRKNNFPQNSYPGFLKSKQTGGQLSLYRDGGIHIDPSKRGTFKAQASRMGMGVQQAASSILNAPEGKYSPAMRKKANFARNFAKADGGYMYQMGGEMMAQQPQGGGGQEEIMQQVAQMLQQGMAPEEIVGQLVQMGVPQEQAIQIVQMIVQQMQGQQQAPQEAPQQAPPMMRRGGYMYQMGGEMAPQQAPQQGGDQEQIMQAIVQMLQQGLQPEQIVGELVKMGIPQEAAIQAVQMVMEQAQQSQGMEQQQQAAPPVEQGMMSQQGAPATMRGGGRMYQMGGSLADNYLAQVNQYPVLKRGGGKLYYQDAGSLPRVTYGMPLDYKSQEEALTGTNNVNQRFSKSLGLQQPGGIAPFLQGPYTEEQYKADIDRTAVNRKGIDYGLRDLAQPSLLSLNQQINSLPLNNRGAALRAGLLTIPTTTSQPILPSLMNKEPQIYKTFANFYPKTTRNPNIPYEDEVNITTSDINLTPNEKDLNRERYMQSQLTTSAKPTGIYPYTPPSNLPNNPLTQTALRNFYKPKMSTVEVQQQSRVPISRPLNLPTPAIPQLSTSMLKKAEVNNTPPPPLDQYKSPMGNYIAGGVGSMLGPLANAAAAAFAPDPTYTAAPKLGRYDYTPVALQRAQANQAMANTRQAIRMGAPTQGSYLANVGVALPSAGANYGSQIAQTRYGIDAQNMGLANQEATLRAAQAEKNALMKDQSISNRWKLGMEAAAGTGRNIQGFSKDLAAKRMQDMMVNQLRTGDFSSIGYDLVNGKLVSKVAPAGLATYNDGTYLLRNGQKVRFNPETEEYELLP